MPSIPLPFVISLVLCLTLVRMLRRGRGTFGWLPLLVATFAMQAFVSGLNWSVGWHPAHLLQPILAAVPPAFSFAAFSQFREKSSEAFSKLWPHLVPAIVVAVLVAVWRSPIDAALFAIYLGYGLALLRVAWLGPNALGAARLGDELTAYRALVAVAVLLIITAFVDAAVSLDLFLGNTERAGMLLTTASVLWLAVAGFAATFADESRPGNEDEDTAENAVSTKYESRLLNSPLSSAENLSETDADAVRRVHGLLENHHVYRDPDLTLQRLARRAGIPAREISGALNRFHGRNVSQIVNEYRVSDARRRLVETRDPVTAIMLASGFGTKSNFNREFLRITGTTPSAYRRTSEENISKA